MLIHCVCGIERTAGEGGSPTIDWCPECGTGATIPPPGRDVHGDGIFEDPSAGYGGNRMANRSQWMSEAEKRLTWVHRYADRRTRILEIGAATGEFVHVAAHHGHPVIGLETSRWAAEAAGDLTQQVQAMDLQTWRIQHPDERFDVVALFHVLEHFDSPGAFLRELLTIATRDTLLFLEVPNGGSSGARTGGAQWWAARLEDHHFHFSPGGMANVLAASGWQVVSARELAMDIYAPRPAPYLLRAGRDLLRPLFGRGRHSKDLLRVVAKPA